MIVPEFSSDIRTREFPELGLASFLSKLSRRELADIAQSSWNQSEALILLKDRALAQAVQAFESGDVGAFNEAASTFELSRAMLTKSQTLGRTAHTNLTAIRLIENAPTSLD